jgi:hypothetical protein
MIPGLLGTIFSFLEHISVSFVAFLALIWLLAMGWYLTRKVRAFMMRRKPAIGGADAGWFTTPSW